MRKTIRFSTVLRKKSLRPAAAAVFGAVLLSGLTAFPFSGLTAFPFSGLTAFADEWIGEGSSWKFQYDDGSFENRGWKWIDGNRDCVSECYFFQEDGTIIASGTTPDGYRVDFTGAWTENGKRQERGTEVSFAVTGDNLIHGQLIRFGLQHGGYDYLYQADLSQELKAADVAVLSQETIYVADPAAYSGYPTFGTPLAVGEAALNAGFNLAACATNHSLDKGLGAIDTTTAFYEERGIPYLGIQSSGRVDYEPYKLITVNGVRLALYDYTYGTNGIRIPAGHPHSVHLLTNPNAISAELALGRAAADAVVVFVHWGNEYEPDPSVSQRAWANVFLESGVDVVVGTHPHVLQPVELREREDGHKMLLYYSLGNMVSRQDRRESSIGGLAEFTLTRTPEGCSVTEYELKPLITHQTLDYSTACLLENYTSELAAAHRMGLSVPQWQELFAAWTKGTGAYWGEPSRVTREKQETAGAAASAENAGAAASAESAGAESQTAQAASTENAGAAQENQNAQESRSAVIIAYTETAMAESQSAETVAETAAETTQAVEETQPEGAVQPAEDAQASEEVQASEETQPEGAVQPAEEAESAEESQTQEETEESTTWYATAGANVLLY